MPKKNDVSINEVLEFLKDHMVMKEDLDDRFLKFEGKMDQKFSKQKHELMNFVEEKLTERLGELKDELIDKLVDKKTFGKLLTVLEKKEVINKRETKNILSVGSFA